MLFYTIYLMGLNKVEYCRYLLNLWYMYMFEKKEHMHYEMFDDVVQSKSTFQLFHIFSCHFYG